MSDRNERGDQDRDEVTLTSAVTNQGQPADAVERRVHPGEDDWRAEEAGETDTPAETGSKVGPGREPTA